MQNCSICNKDFTERGFTRHFNQAHVLKCAYNKGQKGHLAWNRGLTKETDIRVLKCSEKQMGHIRSLETCLKMSLARLGKKQTPEHIAARTAVLKGHKVSSETRKKMSESICKRMENSGLQRFAYVSCIGLIIKMRSNWEVLYAKFLDSHNLIWQYEPKSFKLSNGHRYFPDFYLSNLNEWHEVKGYMSSAAQEKIDLFQKDYPDEKLVIIRAVPNYIESCKERDII